MYIYDFDDGERVIVFASWFLVLGTAFDLCLFYSFRCFYVLTVGDPKSRKKIKDISKN